MGKKSSSSLKKKRSKSSSKAKTKSKIKTKSGKHKSKKVRRREVSLSGSDYDDSKSLDTSASFSSEDTYSYKSKRDRSRSRKDVKGQKKRAQKRSYSPDSSDDSLYDRKRKKAKRKHEYKGRVKSRQTLTSSGSLSCSTCQGESASSDDSQYESRRGRSKRKEKGKSRLERRRRGSKKSSRYRARSLSPCSRSSESESIYERNIEKNIGENNSRRLRSVITIIREVEESREFSRDDTKEEIVDDHDYPCRSNDSNDGATKRELDQHTLPATEEELGVDAETGDVNADTAWISESMKNSTTETSGDDMNGGDLESVLRQKALENLRKFRGGIQSTAKASNQKTKIVSQVKQPISDNNDVVQGKSNINNAAVGTKFDNKTFVEETSVPVGRRNLIAFPRHNKWLNIDKDISGSAMLHLARVPEKVIDADNPSDKSTNYRTNKLELTTPESHPDSIQSHLSLKQENGKNGGTSEASHIASSRYDDVNNNRGLSSAVSKPSSHGSQFGHNHLKKGQVEVKEHSESELKQASASHESPNPKISVVQDGVETYAARNTQASIQCTDVSGGHDESSSSATKSCIDNSSLDNNSAKLQDESNHINQGSQFENKTMNVMRGGEMVQVSYKVYIPKKTPALARRQLKR